MNVAFVGIIVTGYICICGNQKSVSCVLINDRVCPYIAEECDLCADNSYKMNVSYVLIKVTR